LDRNILIAAFLSIGFKYSKARLVRGRFFWLERRVFGLLCPVPFELCR